MNLVFSDQPLPKNLTKSIFLAGPSPREADVIDWRQEAVDYLKSINFQGTIFLPVPYGRFNGSSDSPNWNYHNQVEWECEARSVADIILFWVPRSISGKMPGFVTNIEFGEDLATGKVVYGRPPEAEKCRYMDKRFDDLGYPIHDTMEKTLSYAVKLLGDGDFRQEGEIYVPLFIWKSEQFQSWYSKLKEAGNTLHSAKVMSHFNLPNGSLFSFLMKVKIWIKAEQRFKENEFIFTRKDSVHAVVYYKDIDDLKVILIKEFRSPVNNSEGYVYEIPGGSSIDSTKDVISVLKSELKEEIGLDISDSTRFIFTSSRQSVATLSTHKSDVFKIELNEEEYKSLISNQSTSFGNIDESEKTYIQIVSLRDITKYNIDYSMIGMIYNALIAYD